MTAELARSQGDSLFYPPSASYGLLNILKVDKLGFWPDDDTPEAKLYIEPSTVGDNSTERRRSEIERIRTIRAPARRLGATLAIQLTDGSWLKFFDDGACGGFESCQRFAFLEYNASRGYVLLDHSHGAGGEKIFVWLASGRCVISPSTPVWSPSGHRYSAFGVVAQVAGRLRSSKWPLAAR